MVDLIQLNDTQVGFEMSFKVTSWSSGCEQVPIELDISALEDYILLLYYSYYLSCG